MPSSTKWRINITANYDATPWIIVYEIKMMLAAGGTDQCSGGTASASAEWSSSFDAAKAFDDDEATLWAASATTGWIQYEFAAAKAINSLALLVKDSGPKDFTLDYWDGSAWQSLLGVTGHSRDANPFWRVFGGASKERWRLKVTATHDSGGWLSLAEVQMRGSVGGADLCAGGIGTVSYISSEPANNLCDDDSATNFNWLSSGPHWAEYSFGFGADIAEIVLTATVASNDRAPKDFALEYWDGSAWVEQQAWTGEPAWSSNESRTYAVSGGGAPAARRRPLYIAAG